MRNKPLWILLFILIAALAAVTVMLCIRENETVAAERFYSSLRK